MHRAMGVVFFRSWSSVFTTFISYKTDSRKHLPLAWLASNNNESRIVGVFGVFVVFIEWCPESNDNKNILSDKSIGKRQKKKNRRKR